MATLATIPEAKSAAADKASPDRFDESSLMQTLRSQPNMPVMSWGNLIDETGPSGLY